MHCVLFFCFSFLHRVVIHQLPPENLILLRVGMSMIRMLARNDVHASYLHGKHMHSYTLVEIQKFLKLFHVNVLLRGGCHSCTYPSLRLDALMGGSPFHLPCVGTCTSGTDTPTCWQTCRIRYLGPVTSFSVKDMNSESYKRSRVDLLSCRKRSSSCVRKPAACRTCRREFEELRSSTMERTSAATRPHRKPGRKCGAPMRWKREFVFWRNFWRRKRTVAIVCKVACCSSRLYAR